MSWAIVYSQVETRLRRQQLFDLYSSSPLLGLEAAVRDGSMDILVGIFAEPLTCLRLDHYAARYMSQVFRLILQHSLGRLLPQSFLFRFSSVEDSFEDIKECCTLLVEVIRVYSHLRRFRLGNWIVLRLAPDLGRVVATCTEVHSLELFYMPVNGVNFFLFIQGLTHLRMTNVASADNTNKSIVPHFINSAGADTLASLRIEHNVSIDYRWFSFHSPPIKFHRLHMLRIDNWYNEQDHGPPLETFTSIFPNLRYIAITKRPSDGRLPEPAIRMAGMLWPDLKAIEAESDIVMSFVEHHWHALQVVKTTIRNPPESHGTGALDICQRTGAFFRSLARCPLKILQMVIHVDTRHSAPRGFFNLMFPVYWSHQAAPCLTMLAYTAILTPAPEEDPFHYFDEVCAH